MALTKEKKQKVVLDLKDKIAQQKAMVLVGISGLKVEDLFELRKKLKKADADLKVAKKTLIGKAFKESGLDFDKDKYKQEIAFIFGFKDEILPAKTAYQFSKENKNLKILGGFFEGESKESEEIIALAQIPAKEELFAKLVGSLSVPLSNFVRALNYNIRGLTYIISQIKPNR